MAWKAAQKVFKHWKILRGDKVMVMTGKDRGLTGTVTEVLRQRNRAIVEGLNLVKRHIRPPPGGDKSQGGIVTVESPLHISNLSLLDPETNKPCRVGFKFTEDGTRVRISRGPFASGQVIPRPDILKERRKPRPADTPPAGTLDTLESDAHEMTYEHEKMDVAVGLPPLRLVQGRWQLDVARMGPLVPFPTPKVFRVYKNRKGAGKSRGQEADEAQHTESALKASPGHSNEGTRIADQ